jgi:hypothetical protein
MYVAERGIVFSALIFLILLLIFLARYPVPLPRNVVVHSLAYSLYFLATSLGMLTRTIFGLELSREVSVGTMAVFAICTLIWLLMLTPKGEEVQVTVARLDPGYEERILSQIEALNSGLLNIARK